MAHGSWLFLDPFIPFCIPPYQTTNITPNQIPPATIGAPADPTHVRHLLTGAAFGDGDVAEVSIGGRPFKIGRQFIYDLEKHDLADRIRKLKRPLLVFHSPVDTIVGIENAEKIYKAARHPRSFVSLGNADHLVSRPEDAQFLGHVLSAWAGYYAAPPRQWRPRDQITYF